MLTVSLHVHNWLSLAKIHNIKMTRDILIGYTWAWGGALMIDSSFD